MRTWPCPRASGSPATSTATPSRDSSPRTSARSSRSKLKTWISKAHVADAIEYQNVNALPSLQRTLLVEKHLISRELANGTGERGVTFGLGRPPQRDDERGGPPPDPGAPVRPEAPRGLRDDPADRSEAREVRALRLPREVRIPHRLPDELRHGHADFGHAPPADAGPDEPDPEGFPGRDESRTHGARLLRRGDQRVRRFLPDQQPAHARDAPRTKSSGSSSGS